MASRVKLALISCASIAVILAGCAQIQLEREQAVLARATSARDAALSSARLKLRGALALARSPTEAQGLSHPTLAPELGLLEPLSGSPLLEALEYALKVVDEMWQLPDMGLDEPAFPYLPGEDQALSRSIGDVAEGHLVNAALVAQPHPHLVFLDVQYQRGLFYSSHEMIALLEDVARVVARAHNGSPLYLGNLGRKGGGDIPYSVSHNSGRDADLAFFVVDELGQPAVMPDLLELDRQGRYEGEQGVFVFDAERNWTLIEALLRSKAARVEKILVARWLKRLLLEEAERVGASQAMRDAAKAKLVQPGASLPHNDHFHVRIYCSARDARSGCRDAGPRAGYSRLHAGARRETLKQASALLEAEAAEVRLAAVRRLSVLRARERAKALTARLDDDDARVRAAAARALAELGRGRTPMLRRLRRELHPLVRAELIAALGKLGDKNAVRGLARALKRQRRVPIAGSFEVDERVLVVDALAGVERGEAVESLIGVLRDDDPELRARAAGALRRVTNHEFGGDWRTDSARKRRKAHKAWVAWYKEHGKLDRDQWLVMGFAQAGYQVEALSLAAVWELCAAVYDADHLTYNAQRTLMRLAKRQPDSLAWSREDAGFYWRRYFIRRAKRTRGMPKFDKTAFFKRLKELSARHKRFAFTSKRP